MNIYENNAKKIFKKWPDLEQFYGKKNDNNNKNDSISNIILGYNDEKTIYAQYQSHEYYFHSAYKPVIEAQRWVEIFSDKSGMIVVVGLGLGYHIKELLKIKSLDRIFVIEPRKENFRILLNEMDAEFLMDNRIDLYVGTELDLITAKIYGIFERNLMDGLEFGLFGNFRIEYKEFYDEIIKKQYERIRITRINHSTYEHFKYLWVENIIRNLNLVNNTCSGGVLNNKFAGKPCVIISAGPSLNKNIDMLNDLKQKALLLAGGSAIRILKNKGISPHFITAIDGHPEEGRIFEGLDISDVSLIFINEVYYEVLSKYKCNKFVFAGENDGTSRYIAKRLGIDYSALALSFTVAGVNIDLACGMGCNPVVFVGQDLAFPNMQLHADGATHMQNFENQFNKNPDSFVQTKDIYGKDIITNRTFLSAKKQMEIKIKSWTDRGVKFINATEGGIGLIGAEVLKLEDVVKEWKLGDCNFSTELDNCFLSEKYKIDEQILKETWEQVLSDTEEVRKQFSKLIKLSEKAKKMMIDKENGSKKYNKVIQEISALQDLLEENDFLFYVVASFLRYTLAIHEMIGNNAIKAELGEKERNIARLDMIKNQAAEIVGICKVIEHTIKESNAEREAKKLYEY